MEPLGPNRAADLLEAQSQTKRETHNIDSPILRLPAELRNEIYRLCLPTARETMQIKHLRISLLSPRDGLFRTCRALRKEALSMFYGESQNAWTAVLRTGSTGAGLDEANRWLLSVPREAFPSLKKVQIKLEMRALRIFSQSSRNIVINLNRSAAFVSVESEVGVVNDTRGFRVVKKKVEKFVSRINQRYLRADLLMGVRRDDIKDVIENLTQILEDDKEYSIWSKRGLSLHG